MMTEMYFFIGWTIPLNHFPAEFSSNPNQIQGLQWLVDIIDNVDNKKKLSTNIFVVE